MKVSELVRQAEVTADTVRHYTRIGLLKPKRDPDNGYQIYDNEALKYLRFIRKSPSASAATVIFDELEISVELPLGEPKVVVITPTTSGQYHFSCPTQMYRGTLEVEDA